MLSTALCAAFWLIQAGAPSADEAAPATAPVAARVLGEEIRTADPDEMQYLVIGKLVDRYAADHRIEITPAEIADYIERQRGSMAQDRREFEAKRDELRQQLESRSLTDAERESASSQFEQLTQLLSSLDQDAAPDAHPDAPSDASEEKAAEETVASAFIRRWKINRALYRQYGGRIVYQQSGPEPPDAYRQLLEEQESAGAFEILNESFEPEFWRYYVTDSLHSFYPAGSEEEAQAFDTPPWQMNAPAD